MEVTQEKPLINKVAQSGLVTIDLEIFYPEGEWVDIDLADFLFKGLILKEKEFRDKVKSTDWNSYKGKNLRVFCSTDAIVPPWAYMLIGKHALSVVGHLGYGERESVIAQAMRENLENHLNASHYEDKRILIKGCSTKKIPETIYFAVTSLLMPYCKSLMYGEACSNVPVFKQPVRRK